jgi:ribonuclease Z
VLADGYRLEAAAARHGVQSLAWAFVEDDRPGRFDVDEARRRGVPEGPLYGRLQRGEDVVLDDGTTVRAADLVGEARRGRRIVLSGDTRPCDPVLAAALSADLLIHEATFLEEDRPRARETGHSTAREAAELAREAGVRLLALQHLSARYPPRLFRDEARAVFDATVVPRDLDRIVVPFPERGEPELQRGGGREGDGTAPARADVSPVPAEG